MNKILLALTLLSAGAGGFLAARQATIQLQREANTTREAWLAQTQLVADAQSEQAGLLERVRELKQTLRQTPAVRENAVWSALQTNRAGQLAPELREQVLEELGFNWQSSEGFIMISKEALRDYYIRIQPIRDGKVTDIASTVLALTPGERSQVEAAMERVPTEFKDWALAHVERSEPKDDVLAHYTLPGDPAMSISNNFATGLFDAVGRERAELILASTPNWMSSVGISKRPWTMIVKRYLAGNKQRLGVQMFKSFGTPQQSGDSAPRSLSSHLSFPPAFLPLFPNGWADVAEREGFELPEDSQKK